MPELDRLQQVGVEALALVLHRRRSCSARAARAMFLVTVVEGLLGAEHHDVGGPWPPAARVRIAATRSVPVDVRRPLDLLDAPASAGSSGRSTKSAVFEYVTAMPPGALAEAR